MHELPTVIASSVIRSTHQGESHGGVYIVDLEIGNYQQVIDWDDSSINWDGRGGERGLRGIAFHDGKVYLAAYDKFLVYDDRFEMIASYGNRYLKDCHEIWISGDTLFLTSTGFDSVLEFDLRSRAFTRGYVCRLGNLNKMSIAVRLMLKLRLKPSLAVFDPNSASGLTPGDTFHINSVYYSDGVRYFSGARSGNLLCIENDRISRYARLPYITHNARPFKEGVLLNDTAADRVVYLDRRGHVLQTFSIRHYPDEDLLMSHVPKDHARQGFGRGLCVAGDELIIGGSSPATISVYRFGGPSEALKSVNITMDVRNAIHGLEIWPY